MADFQRGMRVKSDNANEKVKLDLRRYFLERYHVGQSPHVLDCCQGQGVIWSHLRKEFSVASYWGIDQKPKKGRLRIDSARILAQPGWRQDVIDVDTYGSPWTHWEQILRHGNHAMTVFLTIGVSMLGSTRLPGKCFEAMGLVGMEHLTASLPHLSTIQAALYPAAVPYMLAIAGARLVEAVEAVETVETVEARRRARYIGVRLEAA